MSHSPKKLIDMPAVLARVPLCRASVYGMIARGAFPKPIKIGRRSAWLEGEIDQWVDGLADKRRLNLCQSRA
jgi:prophage regulatory protein